MKRNIVIWGLAIVAAGLLCGCGKKEVQSEVNVPVVNETVAEREADSENSETVTGNGADNKTVTLEDIKKANSFEELLKNHTQVSYESTQYANLDVDNGYLGFDNTIIRKDNDSISYLSSAASQSVPFTVVIEKNAKGIYTEKSQFAGESIVETAFESEEDMRAALRRLLIFDSDDFLKEKITDQSMQDDALVVTTVRTPDAGEYASGDITRYYFMNPETLEMYAINEVMPTDSAYGNVATNTYVTYDQDPDFSIEFTEEPEAAATEEDYANMGNAEDGEE